MKYKYRLVEQEKPKGDSEETSIDGDNKKEKTVYDLVLTPQIVSTDEVVKAFEIIKNYGPYISNLRNTKTDVEKSVIDHFGPSQPYAKKKLEKERGKKFPPKTKQTVDTFIRSLTSKPSLLKWNIEGDSLVFPIKHNPTKQVTQNIISTVMKNANINYNLEEKENMNESKINEESFFKFNPDMAFKIYDLILKRLPDFNKEFPMPTSFWAYLNNNY